MSFEQIVRAILLAFVLAGYLIGCVAGGAIVGLAAWLL